jgi:uncharacterized membrane protein
MTEIRPQIKIQKTKIERFMDVLTWIIVTALCVYTIVEYTHLPQTIPIHFNSSGKADGFGNKSTILILPIIVVFLTIMMSLVSKFPHQFNYPNKITPENAFRQYRLATNLIRYLKLAIVFIFSLITISTIWIANGKKTGLGVWFLPVSVGIIFTLIILFIIQSKKNIKPNTIKSN